MRLFELGRQQAAVDLGFTKIAVDPVTLAGGLLAGKTLAMNAAVRHMHQIPGVKHLGQELVGMGYRAAQQGRPVGSPWVRNIASYVTDPKLVGMYETGHALGTNVPRGGAKGIGDLLAQHTKTLSPEHQKMFDMAKGIPTESTGFRKVLDYGHTPVSQVPRDIKNWAASKFQRRGPVTG
jgi:hypothetical protein